MKVISCLVGLCALMAIGVSDAAAQSLKSAVQTALTSNPRIKAQDAAVRAAANELLSSREEYQPELSLFGSIGREYVDDPEGLSVTDNADTKTYRDIGLLAEVTLYDGLRRNNLIYSRASRLDRTMFEFLDASETMSLLVVQAYIDVARQTQLRRIAQDHLERHLEIRSQVENLVSGGGLPLSDLLQVEARVERVRVALTEIELDLRTAQVRYRDLVGDFPTNTLSLPSPPPAPASVDQLVQTSLSNNFQVRQAQANIDTREYERRISEADYQPRLSLRAGTSYGVDLDGSSGDETRNFVGLSVDWTLFRGGRRERTEALAQRRNEAFYQRQGIMRDVDAVARRSWETYQSNLRLRQLLNRQVETNEELVDQYLQELQLATRSLLDVLIAETELFTARFERINSQASLSFSGYRMLASQSQLAQYFDVDSTGELLLLTVQVDDQQRPIDVLQKGQPVLDR